MVTGHDGAGKAVFVSDEQVEPIRPTLMPGGGFHNLWAGDEPPHFPDDGSQPTTHAFFPPVGGFRFGFFSVPPAGTGEPPADLEAALAEFEELVPGMLAHMDPEDPGMHTTATIDFEVVLRGEVTLELDDGATVQLRTGDTVVQNGTRHRWTNAGTEPATLAVFIVGAHHERVGR